MTDLAPAARLSPPHFALALTINALWGLNLVAAKMAVAEIPPIFATAARFGIVLLLCLPWLRLLPGRMRSLLVLGLLFGTAHFGAMFMALALAHDAGVVAVVAQAGVPMSVLMAMVVLREHVSARRWLGIAMTFVGVAIIGFDPRVFDYLDAVAWVLFSGFVYGVSALLMRRLPGISPLTMQAWVALVSAPSLLAISLAIGEPGFAAAPAARWQAWAAVAYSAIGASLVGHAGMFYLLQRYPVAQITPYTMLVPLVALAAGVLLLGDVVTPMILAGAAVTIAGVLIITRSDLATADSRHGAVRDH